MSRHFYSYEENEAYKEGKRDEQNHRTNYDHDRYSDKPEDEAYFLGRKDEENERRIREEEEEYERQRMEAEERRREEQCRRDEEYESYLQMQIEEQIEAERAYMEAMANEHYVAENETPFTEEDLFRQILEDERNASS